MTKVKYVILISIMFFSCTNDEEILKPTLFSYLTTKSYKARDVIACAASTINSDKVLVFYYPKQGATKIKYFQTENNNADKFNYSKYQEITIENSPFFNGYLGVFRKAISNEKWIIITYELDNEIKISNPILTKQFSKPTFWTNIVSINQETSLQPSFSWLDNFKGDNAIYFQVISDSNNNLLSGTYTYQNHFQYYNTSNVVLNITEQTPPDLVVNNRYNFTLMDVSEDNWVNLIIQKEFTAK